MKQELILSFLVISALSLCWYYAIITEEENKIELEFLDFISKYNKNYNTVEEYEYRLEVFKENVIKISNFNFKNPKASFKMNKFGDYDKSDLSQLLSLLPMTTEIAFDTSQSSQSDLTLMSPISWSNYFPNASHQGDCNASWAFTAASCYDLFYALSQNQTKITKTYSTQQLVDWIDQKYSCKGGNAFQAVFDMQMRQSDWCTSEEYQYEEKKYDWRQIEKCKSNKNSEFLIKMMFDELELLINLKHGAVVVDVNADEWVFYHEGIIEDCGEGDLNHSALVVGTDARDWVELRNSWGVEWGELGNIRLSINPMRNMCKYATRGLQMV